MNVFTAAQAPSHGRKPAEERLDEREQLLTGGGESKRSSMKQRLPEILFEPQHLRADGWLLDTVRSLSRCRADSTVPRYIIKKLQVMNVHRCSVILSRSIFGES